MKYFRYILFSIFTLFIFTTVQGKQPTIGNETNVPISIVRKFKYIFDSDEDFRHSICEWYNLYTMREGYEKMNEMLEKPNIAKPILYYIFNVYGTGDFSYIHLTRSYGFTDQEYNIALSIYQEHKKKLEEEAAEEQRRQIIKETEDEKTLLRKWTQNGPDVFMNLNDSHIILPEVTVNLNHLSDELAKISSYKPLSDFAPSKISFYISPDKSIENLVVDGSLSPILNINDIIVNQPAKYKFEHIDNILPVPCKYSLQINEDADLLGYLECKIKYNKKKELWEIEILDNEGDTQLYQWIYNNIEYKDFITPSAKDAIASAILQAVDANDGLKSKLIKGKHKLDISVYNHYIKFKSNQAYLQPFVDSIVVDKK